MKRVKDGNASLSRFKTDLSGDFESAFEGVAIGRLQGQDWIQNQARIYGIGIGKIALAKKHDLRRFYDNLRCW